MKDNIRSIDKFPGQRRAGLIITADFELAWAVQYSKRNIDSIEYGQRERNNIPVILRELSKYNVPITWATVGHLFLHSCSKGDHDWMHKLSHFDDHWSFTAGDWFKNDPCTSYHEAPEWYAPDLIQLIVDSEVPHEIGCHTFSHIDCSEKHCPPQVLDDELKACKRAAGNLNIEFRSMAFPGGTAGNFQVLKKHGIKIYRRRIGKFELAYPYRDESGLLVSPTGPSIGLAHAGWSVTEEFRRYRKAIDKSINYKTLAHMWFHPSAEEKCFTELLPMILEYSAKKRDQGLLWIGTMDEIQKHINSKGLV